MNRTSRYRWHPLLTVVILLCLSLTAWAVVQAREKVSPVSDKDYYRNGLTYNVAEQQQAAGQTAGWSIKVHLEGTLLTIRLVDRDGTSVTGAKGEIILLGSHPGTMKRLDFVITETSPGLYEVRLPEGLSGQVMTQLVLAKGQVSMHRSMLLNL